MSIERSDVEAPSTNLQTPEKLQVPSRKGLLVCGGSGTRIVYQAGRSGRYWLKWRLLFGVSLVLGAWMLVLW